MTTSSAEGDVARMASKTSAAALLTVSVATPVSFRLPKTTTTSASGSGDDRTRSPNVRPVPEATAT
jgi:hypothetical protein